MQYGKKSLLHVNVYIGKKWMLMTCKKGSLFTWGKSASRCLDKPFLYTTLANNIFRISQQKKQPIYFLHIKAGNFCCRPACQCRTEGHLIFLDDKRRAMKIMQYAILSAYEQKQMLPAFAAESYWFRHHRSYETYEFMQRKMAESSDTFALTHELITQGHIQDINLVTLSIIGSLDALAWIIWLRSHLSIDRGCYACSWHVD